VKNWKKVKTIAAFLLVPILGLNLAACGDTKNDPSGTGAPQTSTAPQSDVKLTMWHWKVAFDPGFKAVADAFKKKTGITVETQPFTPDTAYIQKVSAAAVAGNLPDIYMYWSDPQAGAFDGKAMNMTEELAKDPDWKNSFYPSALAGDTVNQGNVDTWSKDEKKSAWVKSLKVGDIYGIPIDIGSNYTVYGNAKLFKQAGLPATPPSTIEEWLTMMNTIKEKTQVPGLVFSVKTMTVYENWFANFVDYMKNGPESFAALMQRNEKMSDPKHFGFAKFIEDVAQSGNFVPGIASLDIDPADQAFASGKAAFDIGGTFTYASLLAMGMSPDDIISFRAPAYQDSTNANAKITPIPLLSAFISDKTPHKKESVEFVKFLTSPEGALLYANAANSIPSIKLSEADTKKLTPVLQRMLSSLSAEDSWWAKNASIATTFGPEWQRFNDNIQKIMLGQMTAQQVAEQFDKDAAAEKAKSQ